MAVTVVDLLMYDAISADGKEVRICEGCKDSRYETCDHCGELVLMHGVQMSDQQHRRFAGDQNVLAVTRHSVRVHLAEAAEQLLLPGHDEAAGRD